MTCSRHVTNVVEPKLTDVLRTIRARIPGFSKAIRFSFSRHTLDFPVPAGPQARTSSSRASMTVTAFPRGVYAWTSSRSAERVKVHPIHPVGGDLPRDLLLRRRIQTEELTALSGDLHQPVDRGQHRPIVANRLPLLATVLFPPPDDAPLGDHDVVPTQDLFGSAGEAVQPLQLNLPQVVSGFLDGGLQSALHTVIGVPRGGVPELVSDLLPGAVAGTHAG